jgi:hypothetical protein
VREDQILPHLAALAILLNGTVGTILIYDPDTRTIRTGDSHPIAVTAAARC